MISQIESMEANPSTAARNFIEQTKIAAQFTFYRAMFEQILQEGVALASEQKYTDSIDVYYSGFSLYRDDFYDEEYSDEFFAAVDEQLAVIVSTMPQYELVQSALINAVNAYNTAVESNNFAGAQNALLQVTDVMQDFAFLRNSIANAGWVFQASFDELLVANPELTEASYLPFIARFTNGRVTDPSTGMLGTMDMQWDTLVSSMKQASYETVNSNWDSALALIASDGLTSPQIVRAEIEQNMAQASNFAQLGTEVNALYTLLQTEPNVLEVGRYTEYVEGMNLIQDFEQIVQNELDTNIAYVDLRDAVTAYNAGREAIEDIQADNREAITFFIQSGLDFENFAEEAAQNTGDLNTAYLAYRNIEQTTSAPDFSIQYSGISEMTNLVNRSALDSQAQVRFSLASYIRQGSQDIFAQYNTEYLEAEQLFAGVSREDGSISRYPAEVSQAMNALINDSQRDEDTIQSIYETIAITQSQEADITSRISEQMGSITQTVTDLQTLRVNAQNLLASANAQSLQANSALQEAELRYNQSINALNRSDFDTARENLDIARQRFNDSLSFQESDDLRVSADERLASLGEEINRSENELVIAQVRTLLTQAKDEYYIGNFENANRLLNQARTRWAVTNIDPNPEVSQWLTLTGTAIASKSGRVLAPTAPLYPEMSQLLSVANQLYDQGLELMENESTSEALLVLDDARQKIKEVQIVYPINQEAGLLALKIDQLIDPNNFENVFERRFEQALNTYQNPETQQTAYADLLDLANLRPNYPGIQNAIVEVEIFLGFRLPPPDPRDIARSNSLIAQARDAQNSTVEVELLSAIAQLDEALNLVPDNDEAAFLKDQLQSRVGGQAVAVLDASSENMYQQAIQELQRNNIINAAALVAQLMQIPNNTRSPKVLDLQQRIRALTGQGI